MSRLVRNMAREMQVEMATRIAIQCYPCDWSRKYSDAFKLISSAKGVKRDLPRSG